MPTLQVKDASNVTQTINTIPNAGQVAMAASQPVAIASDQSPVPFSIAGSSAATITRVAFTTASAALLAANAGRRRCTIYNEGAGTAYVLFGAGTASATNYTVQIAFGGFMEVVTEWRGALAVVGVSAAGTLMVTELT